MKRPITLLTTLLAATLLAGAASAYATTGTYQVPACNFAPEGANHSWIWSSTDPSSTDHYTEHESCPDRIGGNGGRTDQESGLSTTDTLGLSNGTPPGTSAGWSFFAPTGTTIAGISYERYIGHVFDPGNYWMSVLRVDGTIVPGESCLDTAENSWSCYVGGPPNEGVETKTITGLTAQELTLGITCQAHTEEQCVTGATQHSAWAAMYGATVTINDPTPPTLNTPTGPLWEPNQYTKGTKTLTTSAEDIGGGVQTLELQADGHPIQTYTATCDYTHPKPCPATTGEQTLTLNTTELADGPHTLSVIAIDAAGQHSTAATKQIDVENNPPPSPTNLAANPTETSSRTFEVAWTDPNGLTAPIVRASYQICSIDGPGGCNTPVTVQPTSPITVTVPGPGKWRLSLWLTNAAGNSNPADSAEAELIVPESEPTQTTSTPNSGVPPSLPTSPIPALPGAPPPTTQATTSLHVLAYVHNGHIIVRARDQTNGRLRITLTEHYQGKSVILGVKIGRFSHGQLTVTFKLPRDQRTGRARLAVVVTLTHGPTVRELLRR